MVICTRDHHCSFPSLFFFFFVPFPFLGFISGILLDVLHVCINTSNEISCNLYSFCARRLYTFIMLLWWFIIWDWHDAMWWFLVEDINNITSHSTPKEMYIILDSAVYIVLFFLTVFLLTVDFIMGMCILEGSSIYWQKFFGTCLFIQLLMSISDDEIP